jgi:hypothetical protein
MQFCLHEAINRHKQHNDGIRTRRNRGEEINSLVMRSQLFNQVIHSHRSSHTSSKHLLMRERLRTLLWHGADRGDRLGTLHGDGLGRDCGGMLFQLVKGLEEGGVHSVFHLIVEFLHILRQGHRRCSTCSRVGGEHEQQKDGRVS